MKFEAGPAKTMRNLAQAGLCEKERCSISGGTASLLIRVLAKHFDIPAQRNPGENILGFTDLSADGFGRKSHRETFDFDAHRFRNQEMAELMNKNKNAQYDYCGNNCDTYHINMPLSADQAPLAPFSGRLGRFG